MRSKEIYKEIQELEQKKRELETKFIQAFDEEMQQAVETSAQEQKIERIAPKICIVHFSDIIGKPWNYEFHDWQAGARVLKEHLEKYPVETRIDKLKELRTIAKGKVVTLKSKERTIPISIELVERIIAKLEN